jgi:hypothetical protein
MKNHYVITVLMLIVSFAAYGQTSPGEGCDCCFIRYAYDGAGNRVKRDFYCEAQYPSSKSGVTSSKDSVRKGLVLLSEDSYWYITPNPNNGRFRIVFSVMPENYTMLLLQDDGKLISSQKINSKENDVDYAYLPSGAYYIVVSDNKKTTSKKIIISK